MKKILTGACLSLCMAVANATIEGALSRSEFFASVCNIKRMTVDASIVQTSGEPTVKARMRWEAGSNTASNCLATNTTVYLEVGERFGVHRYTRLDPQIRVSGTGYGESVTWSPNWENLFCDQADSEGNCLSARQARQYLASKPPLRSFVVVTRPMAVRKRDALNELDLDRMLDETIGKLDGGQPEVEDAEIEPAPPPRVVNAFASTSEEASRNVIALLNSSLSQYKTPPSNCASSRRVANWVQASDACRMTFRSETSHAYTCTDDGRPTQVLNNQSAVVDFSKDIDFVANPLVSRDGWVAVVVRFNNALALSGRYGIKGDRWQFAASDEKVSEMKELAGNLQALQQHCGDPT